MTTILGAGLGGLAAGYGLKQQELPFIIYEQEDGYGGLCRKIEIDGFTFDRFVHFCFTEDPEVRALFDGSAKESFAHRPLAFNYYKGHWLAHPAQNNLYPLPAALKEELYKGFADRGALQSPNDYQEWLDASYGKPFSRLFPSAYTRKYWTTEPNLLETKWVGERVIQSSLEEVQEGLNRGTPSTKFYTKEMRYPKKGGYQSYADAWAPAEYIKYNHKLIAWDTVRKELYFENGATAGYSKIISTLPLPYIINIIKNSPASIKEAAQKLHATKGVTISIGLRGSLPNPMLWFYVYDEDIPFARVYSPSLKSPNNTPNGCSSLQAEIYFSCFKPLTESPEALIEKTIDALIKMGQFTKGQLIFAQAHVFEYANVIFTKDIYECRRAVHDWLASQDIKWAGRFGDWGYLWSGQSARSGLDIVKYIQEK